MSKTLELHDKLVNAVHLSRTLVLAIEGDPEEATAYSNAIAHQAAVLLDHLEALEDDLKTFRRNWKR